MLTFSLAPLVTTFWPVITLRQTTWGLAACTVLGIAAAALLVRRKPGGDEAAADDPGGNKRPPGMDRARWRQELRERRVAWRTPRIDTPPSGRRSAWRAGSAC